MDMNNNNKDAFRRTTKAGQLEAMLGDCIDSNVDEI
jgi:hypothetical protein